MWERVMVRLWGKVAWGSLSGRDEGKGHYALHPHGYSPVAITIFFACAGQRLYVPADSWTTVSDITKLMVQERYA